MDSVPSKESLSFKLRTWRQHGDGRVKDSLSDMICKDSIVTWLMHARRLSKEQDKNAPVTKDRSKMSNKEKIDFDIAEAQKIIRMHPDFFAQLYDYRKAKLAFDALWASIAEREDTTSSLVDLLPVDNTVEHEQMVKDGPESLPRPCRSYEDLCHAGTARKQEFGNLVRKICVAAGMDPDFRIQQCPEKGNPKVGKTTVQIGPLKTRERSEEKVKDDYDGNFAKLFDVVRASILCTNSGQILACLKALQERDQNECTIVRIKNRFRDPLFTGYRDIMILISVGNNLNDGTTCCPHICELQLHHVDILSLKSESHRPYEYFRSYFRGGATAADDRLKKLLSLARNDECGMESTVARILTQLNYLYEYEDDEKGDIILKDVYGLHNFFRDMGLLDLATIPCRLGLEIGDKRYGDEYHPERECFRDLLGELLLKQNRLEEAEALLRKVLQVKEEYVKEWGYSPENPEILFTVHYLAGLLEKRSKLDDAEALYRRAVDGIEKELELARDNMGWVNDEKGKREMVQTSQEFVADLGNLLRKQNKLDEACKLIRSALEWREQALGPDHPETLSSVKSLGELVQRQGKLDDAEGLYRRALEGNEKALGPDHPDTLQSVHHLGDVLRRQGKLDEAAVLCRRALRGREEALGSDHPNTLKSASNLGLLFESLEKQSDAEVLHRRALDGMEKAFGLDHKETLKIMDNLGSLLAKQDRLEEAEILFRTALEERKKTLGSDHPDTMRSARDLEGIIERGGNHAKCT